MWMSEFEDKILKYEHVEHNEMIQANKFTVCNI